MPIPEYVARVFSGRITEEDDQGRWWHTADYYAAQYGGGKKPEESDAAHANCRCSLSKKK